MSLEGKTILITGSARRLGKEFALAAAQAGADLIIHHAHSPEEADQTAIEIEKIGRKAWVLQANLEDPLRAANLVDQAWEINPLFALVNSASIFEPLTWNETSLVDWNRHFAINLTSPFMMCQAFARHVAPSSEGRIINILDWRALHPGRSHFPYTISKAGLASLTQALALSLAPTIMVNGLALGAILPPSDGSGGNGIIKSVPAGRWAYRNEADAALIFLLDGPAYITGEIIHLDGGRHLV